MTCADCGMLCQGTFCKPCALTREMEELQQSQKAAEAAQGGEE